MPLKLSDLLFEKYMEYQKKAEKRKTLKQFAAEIGIGEVFLNQLMNGHRSGGEATIAHLADFFHDMRFYDAVNLPRPDPRLHYVSRNWGNIPPKTQKQIAEEVQKYTSEKAPED